MALSDAQKALAATAAAIALASPVVVRWEGTVDHGYRDLGGVVTACTGHTGADAVMGRRYTAAECKALLATDLARHAALIRPCVPATTPVESQAAFLSLAFNIGGAAFCRSSTARRLKAGDLAGACAAMSGWAYVNGRRIEGLARRRAAERALCEQGVPA